MNRKKIDVCKEVNNSEGWHAFGIENEIPGDEWNGMTMTVCHRNQDGVLEICDAIYRNNHAGGRYFIVSDGQENICKLRNVVAWREPEVLEKENV